MRLLAGDASDTNFHETNEWCYDSLWNVVMLDHELQKTPIEPKVKVWADQLHTLLPFDKEELEALAGRMAAYIDRASPETAVDWYSANQRDDVLALDRWRRWLDEKFSGVHRAEGLSDEGSAMLGVLENLTQTLNADA